uniref:Uncharacterized protein n=1 Tax=Ursus maritimus TaxID=29073 RepID=A0A452UZI2_URSMA
MTKSELISGFNTDYVAGPLALFFLVENAVIINIFTTVLFLGFLTSSLVLCIISLTFTTKLTHTSKTDAQVETV